MYGIEFDKLKLSLLEKIKTKKLDKQSNECHILMVNSYGNRKNPERVNQICKSILGSLYVHFDDMLSRIDTSGLEIKGCEEKKEDQKYLGIFNCYVDGNLTQDEVFIISELLMEHPEIEFSVQPRNLYSGKDKYIKITKERISYLKKKQKE